MRLEVVNCIVLKIFQLFCFYFLSTLSSSFIQLNIFHTTRCFLRNIWNITCCSRGFKTAVCTSHPSLSEESVRAPPHLDCGGKGRCPPRFFWFIVVWLSIPLDLIKKAELHLRAPSVLLLFCFVEQSLWSGHVVGSAVAAALGSARCCLTLCVGLFAVVVLLPAVAVGFGCNSEERFVRPRSFHSRPRRRSPCSSMLPPVVPANGAVVRSAAALCCCCCCYCCRCCAQRWLWVTSQKIFSGDLWLFMAFYGFHTKYGFLLVSYSIPFHGVVENFHGNGTWGRGNRKFSTVWKIPCMLL